MLAPMLSSSTIRDLRTRITGIRPAGPDVSIISIPCPEIAATARPGNFVNIKVSSSDQPLLRRPSYIAQEEWYERRILLGLKANW